MTVSAAHRARPVGDHPGQHEHHAQEDRRVRGELLCGDSAVVVIEAGRDVREDVGNDREGDDDEADPGQSRESVERFGREPDEVEQARWAMGLVASAVRSVHVSDGIGGVGTAIEIDMNGA
jgi:hypothetical protein